VEPVLRHDLYVFRSEPVQALLARLILEFMAATLQGATIAGRCSNDF
jgi:hypothetical protein